MNKSITSILLFILITSINSCTPTTIHHPLLIENGTWKPQLDKPNASLVSSENGIKSAYIVAYKDGILWINNNAGSLFKYDTLTKKITPYLTQSNGRIGIPLFPFLTSRNGNLWVLGFSNQGKGLQAQLDAKLPLWIIRYYDSKTDTFIEVHDPEKVLFSQMLGHSDFVEDRTGVLWILVHTDPLNNGNLVTKLISYNPQTGKASTVNLEQNLKSLSLVNNIVGMAIDSRGMIWLSVEGMRSISGEPNFHWKILRFNPETGNIDDYGYPQGEEFGPPSLFFDHTGRLWVSSIAWMDFPVFGKAEWSPTVQPFQLIYRDYWNPPETIYETSDGSLWMGTSFGLVIYNPETNNWYKPEFVIGAQYSGINVIEDNLQQVWLVANGQIYKLQPK